MNYEAPKETAFDQKAYIQIRINKLIERVDFLNTNPFLFNPSFGEYNYKIIVRDLESIYDSISSKLDEEEKEKYKIKMGQVNKSISIPITKHTITSFG